MTKRESSYHHGDLRNALVNAGMEILKTSGSEKLSLREAARIAGVSQAAPYRHFKNKEALLAAIAQESFHALGRRIQNAVAERARNPEEQAYEAAMTYFNAASEMTDHFRLMYCTLPPTSAEKYPDLNRAAEGMFAEFVRLIERCQKAQIVRAGDAQQLAMIAWSSFHGLTSLIVNRNLDFLALRPDQTQHVIREQVRALLSGLAPA